MDGVRDQFFTRARFAINQDAAIRRRHQLDLLAQRFHGDAVADDHALGIIAS